MVVFDGGYIFRIRALSRALQNPPFDTTETVTSHLFGTRIEFYAAAWQRAVSLGSPRLLTYRVIRVEKSPD